MSHRQPLAIEPAAPGLLTIILLLALQQLLSLRASGSGDRIPTGENPKADVGVLPYSDSGFELRINCLESA
jgi:hypothetical protein